MSLPFDRFQGKEISTFSSLCKEKVPSAAEPISVLDSLISPTSSSTLSSSHTLGGGGGCSLIHGDDEQCVLPTSPTHDDHSILRLIMGDSQDPSLELNNILQPPPPSLGFGVVDTPFSFVPPSQPPLLINQSQTHFTHNSAVFYAPGPMDYPDPRMMITEQLLKAAEVIESGGDTCLAQEILARLNQQLSSPTGRPFERAAFYFREALQNLLHNVSQKHNPYSLIFKIAAYKSFSEISPVLQFANFTSNQTLLESFQGFHRLHIIEFDIGYGGQWASFMQELVLRDNSVPISLKITILASPETQDQIELGFTQENLKLFASEINISLDIQVLSLDLISSFNSSENEAVAFNMSAASFSKMPLVLRFVSPRIIVCSERGWERTHLPFPQQLIYSLNSHAALLESLDAVNANLDAMQKIERFLIQPEIEKLVVDRSRPMEKPMMTWQAMLIQMGFSPLTHSNFTESQAECLVQRTPVRGFHVEKKQNSLLLCWQRRELVGVSAWRCRS